MRWVTLLYRVDLQRPAVYRRERAQESRYSQLSRATTPFDAHQSSSGIP